MAGSGFQAWAPNVAKTVVGSVGFSAIAGGVGAELTGGEFWKGAVIGATVAGLNHLMHNATDGDGDGDRNPKQDKPLSKGEIDKLKKAGWDHSDKGDGGGKIDLYKDKRGNVYEKAKGNKGPGEPIGVNLNNLKLTSVNSQTGWNLESMRNHISTVTGLTGAALTAYIIISEGSRFIFPVRNLSPIP